ncbi:PadR family transcriptional regulator [Coralliovum pocilloporae]|uniref:PadR family transcriptional regulator n=1 Tax=Coralliovum pocilloporae TaxID=3066369 RepID=UPI0033072390
MGMNVRTLCLSILYFQEATGYEIRKLSTEGRFSHFVDASFGSIYPALGRLEQDGLVTSREETQIGKPARKIFSITEAGRQTFIEELNQPPSQDVFRSEFLMIGMCAELVDAPRIAAAIETRLGQLDAELEHITSVLEDCEHPGTRWVCEYGLHCISSSKDYLTKNRARLEAIAEQAAAARDAAE